MLPPLPSGRRLEITTATAVGIGGRIWESASVLCNHLVASEDLEGKRVIELGSGTGAVGLFASGLGAHRCLLTDGHEGMVDLIERNIERNDDVASPLGTTIVKAAQLQWGTQHAQLDDDDAFDVILGADLTYDDDAHDVLATTLRTLLSTPDARAILAEEHGVPRELESHSQNADALFADENLEHFLAACTRRGLQVLPLSSPRLQWPMRDFFDAVPFVIQITADHGGAAVTSHSDAAQGTTAAPSRGASLPEATYEVQHEDADLLVVNKGHGLLSVPGVGVAKQDCLLSRLRTHGYPEILHAPHRLDRDTSGLLALGRTRAAHRGLCKAFEARLVQKRYEALVRGWPASDVGDVHHHIGKVRQPAEAFASFRLVAAGADGAQAAHTRWKVLQRSKLADGSKYSRVALEPVTGRPHQLRLHMLHLGHPILGDELHAGCAESVRAGQGRLCLHAAALAFEHPTQHGVVVSVESDAPF